MGVVCKAWKSTTSMFEKILSLPPGFPLVLLPSAVVAYVLCKTLTVLREENMGDWANLPTDILILVVKRLVHMEDFFVMGAVCKSWKSMTSMFEKIPSLPPGFPLILLTSAVLTYEDLYAGIGFGFGGIYCLSTLKTYEFELPEATERKCLGTVRGWLLTVDLELCANLLHPFSRRQIPLPRFLAFKQQFPKYRSHPQALRRYEVKLAMSRDPLHENTSREDCIIVVIARYLISFARLGDQVWTSIAANSSTVYDDIVYYKGVFYTVNRSGVLHTCDVYNNDVAPKAVTTPIATVGARTYLNESLGIRRYLVESSGDLLLVSRLCRPTTAWLLPKSDPHRPVYSTTDFLVHKLEREESADTWKYPYRWKEINNLGGRALFLGGNASVSSGSSKRVKPDCIYFSEDEQAMYDYMGGWCLGIYNMKNGIIESLKYPSEIRFPNPPIMYI